ncbi:tRNA (adenosine(37)-N6)-threonylcarbamoyltransferase complex dimerization subunit type 1 TsaB [Alienimonas chondri]|uniref:Gcp-like domain-containing protein n=1 Tax=Alienimonas chondri TaxID=2681879 RepID=A0ABX1VGV9_9PLAN|nr:tRNA (adenosine(37)-N6)-threonylcarbamoyltransferase complex dimerization subunit type 1 TsaB [Alienimonas chondri]NNJ26735.1 hypothetical protein [Alienimonas chondri]
MSEANDRTPATLAVDLARGGHAGTLFLVDREGLWEHASLDLAGRRNARTLVPEAAALCERHGMTLADLDLVCVSIGPGSFTGLRVGVTFAKMLAFAAGCDVIGVPSHLSVRRIVQHVDPPGTRLRVVSDALRGDVYLTDVTVGPLGEPPIPEGPRLVSAEEIEEGDDLVRYGENPGGTSDASTVFNAALERWRQGVRDDPFALAPLYVRRSSAEEKADEQRS